MIEHSIFFFLSSLIVVCSLFVICARHPVKSAIFLVMDLFLIAGMYALLEAHFIAAIQVLVYTGAITVLFVFVIMLLNLQADEQSVFRLSFVEIGSLVFLLLGFFAVMITIYHGQPTGIGGSNMTVEAVSNEGGNTRVVALQLLGKYIWPFEIASILILLAIVASVVIAKKEKSKISEGVDAAS